jgi:transcriptional regulator with XRE-family HTH domain
MTIGDHLRNWRQRRRLSQLAFALQAEVSQKHLSFIESGRSQPSRDMVLRLAEHLNVPLRERNAMVLAAGYAPAYPERSLDDPALAPARTAISLILKGHEPYPALAVDRHWQLIDLNAGARLLLGMVADKHLLTPPINVLRLSLDIGGLAPHIVNLAQWRTHVFTRLTQQIAMTGDPVLIRLQDELQALPTAMADGVAEPQPHLSDIAVPIRLRTPAGILSLISTVTIFGTPVDITLSEIALEAFYPADRETAILLEGMKAGAAGED